MLDKTLEERLLEVIASNFDPAQIDEIGSRFARNYCSQKILGLDEHVTVPVRKASNALIDYCTEKKCEDELVKMIIEMDGQKMNGRTITIPETEEFLSELARSGFVYDWKKRKLKNIKGSSFDLPNWGSLREGRQYDVTVASIDIVGNSELVKKHGLKKMEKMYFRLWKFLRRCIEEYDGRIWNWAGDGGILAFALKNHIIRGVRCCLEVQSLLPVFNIDPDNPIPDNIQVRIALDSGKIKYSEDTGRIVSDTINFAAHLEKQFTPADGISVSENIMERLTDKLKTIFWNQEEFEGRTICQVCIPGLQ